MKVIKLFVVIGALVSFASAVTADIVTQSSIGDEADHISLSNEGVLLVDPGQIVRYGKSAVGLASQGRVGVSDAANPASSFWGSYVTNGMTVGIPEWKSAGSGPSEFRLLKATAVGTADMVTLTALPLAIGGKSVRFPVRFDKGSSPYILSTLRAKYRSSDSGNLLGFEVNFSTNNYSSSRVGYRYTTADGRVRIASGPGTNPVDEIHYIGVANGFVAKSVTDIQTIFEIVANNAQFAVGAQYFIKTVAGKEIEVSSELSFNRQPTTLILSGSSSGKAILAIRSGFPGHYRIERANTLREPFQTVFTLVKDSADDVPSAVVTLGGPMGFYRAFRLPD